MCDWNTLIIALESEMPINISKYCFLNNAIEWIIKVTHTQDCLWLSDQHPILFTVHMSMGWRVLCVWTKNYSCRDLHTHGQYILLTYVIWNVCEASIPKYHTSVPGTYHTWQSFPHFHIFPLSPRNCEFCIPPCGRVALVLLREQVSNN